MQVDVCDGDGLIKLMNSLNHKGNVYLVGAGKYGKIIGRFLINKNVSWSGYIDKKDDLKELNNKIVYSYSLNFTEKDYFVISSVYFDSVTNYLKQIDIKDDNVFILPNIREVVYDIYEALDGWRKYVNKVQIFKNKYSGKRCFIIGNGPSLKISDLEKLIGEITFACNSIYILYKKTFWRPTFYCAYDDIFCEEVLSDKDSIKKITSGCKAVFISMLRKAFQFRDDVEMRFLYYIVTKERKNKKTSLPLFSDDCSKQTYTAGTVSYIMLQLAVYMGFREIYLLGMDCSYSVERYSDGSIIKNNIINHHKLIEEEDKKYEKIIMERVGALADIDKQIAGYKSAKEYAENHGIKIYNATRGGKLEVFERIDFDKIM